MHGFFWREKETARKFEKSRVESYTNEKTLKGVARVDWVNFLIKKINQSKTLRYSDCVPVAINDFFHHLLITSISLDKVANKKIARSQTLPKRSTLPKRYSINKLDQNKGHDVAMIFVYTLFETYHKLGFFFYPLPLPVTAASAKTMHQVNAIQFHQYLM